MKKVDVSVNITAHREGILVHKTLRSIYAGVMFARSRGVEVECNLSLDNADNETTGVVKKFIIENPDLGLAIHEISVGDISLNRNYLVERSKGKYLAFFDGDDFFTENYLYEAFTFAEKHDEPAVYSPRYLLVFEGDNYLVEKLDSENFPEVFKNMFETNYFIGQSFTHRDVYKKIKYQPDGNGYGMEDWHFSCEAAALGYKFYNVPNTIFFYRRKKAGSLLASHVDSLSVIRPTKLFRSEVYAALPADQSTASEKMPGNGIRSLGIKRYLMKKSERYELTHHYILVQYTLHKNIISSLKRRYQKTQPAFIDTSTTKKILPQRLADIGFTEELIYFWGRVNQFEPMIRASVDMLAHIPIVGYPRTSNVSDFYYDFCTQNKGITITDVVLVPHLTKGGADLAAINLIRELDRNAVGGKILVVTTIEADSPWLDQVRKLKNVICIEGKLLLPSIDDDKLITLLLRVIQNWDVERLNIINSEIGYKLVARHHQAIRDVGCRTFLHTYAFNMTDDGYLFNVIPNGLIEAYAGVDMYITDSNAYKRQLQEICGFSEDKVVALYSSIDLATNKKTDYHKKQKILWASRICDDKLVDVMVEVGRKLQDKGVNLDVFGSLDKEYEKNGRFEKMIAPYQNISYKGSYDGFSSLDTNDYDMYLLTTKNEGMPFVVLEACSANIYMITAAVGGIPECIVEGKNGSLIQDKFNPEAYASAILKAYEDGSFMDEPKIKVANKKILSRHSLENYADNVKKILDL